MSSVSRIVSRVQILEAEWANGRHLRNVFAGFGPMEMGRIAGQHDYRAGRIRLQLVGIELITEPNVEDAGNDGVYPVLGMPMRHQFHIVRNVNPDGVRAFL